MAKVKIIKKVGIPKDVSAGWFDNLVKCAMMTPVLLRRIGKLERKIRQLDPKLKGREHILVWRNVGGLGDIVMQSTIAKALKEKDPNCFITYQVPEQYLTIPQHNPYVDKAEIAECPFCEDGYDRTIKLSQPCPASVYESIRGSNIIRNRIDLFLKAANIRTDNKNLIYKTKEYEGKWVEEFLKRHKILDKVKIGFELRSAEPRRDWYGYKDLTRLLKKWRKDIAIFIFDHSVNMAWKDNSVINICGFPINEVAAIVERMDLLICPDSGLVHLAGALGTKILGLFGPTDPRMRLNIYKNADWIWPRDKCKESPCWYSYSCGNSRCMRAITPQMVMQKIDENLSLNTTEAITISGVSDENKRFIAPSILVKMPSGELGDKLVGLVLVNKIKQENPDSQLDVFLQSDRFNTMDGYARLFRDCASHCFVNESEILDDYQEIYEISAYGIHDDELDCVREEYVQLSRYQRWAKKMKLNLREYPKVIYRVKEEDGERIREEMGFKDLKHPIVGISPLTSNRTKEWEQLKDGKSPKWQKVIDYLNGKGCSCVSIHYVPLEYDNCLNLGHLNLNELGYVISKLDLLVATEAGTTHFAGMLGIPMIVIVGSSSPLVLRHYKNVRILRKGKCMPCNRFITSSFSECRCGSLNNNPKSKCIVPITAEEVIEEIKFFKSEDFKKYGCLL